MISWWEYDQAISTLETKRVKCTASDAFSADLVFFLASVLRHQYVANACRLQSR